MSRSAKRSGPWTRTGRALLLVGTLIVLSPPGASGQADTTLAQEGVYDRPFIASVSSTSVGGYVEGNTNYFVEDGVSDGFSMELRRFNIFLFSQPAPRVRFLSELEFEHGTEEIALETAQLDVQIRPELSLRAGIILPPLGFVNQNHDSPRWDFVERPLVSTGLIPSTLSEVGFGAFGRFVTEQAIVSYDAYLTNGLGEGVVDNELGRTDIASGRHEEAFAEDNNGSPAFSGRVAARRPDVGELGVSLYTGAYNRSTIESVEVAESRRLTILALDVGARVAGLDVRSEIARASIDIPPGLVELFGATQWGGHVDVLWDGLRPRLAGYPDARLLLGVRFEHIDYNSGTFSSTGLAIGDQETAIVPTVSLRPAAGTVLRINYRFHWLTDFPGNDPARRAGFQIGFASYF